MDSTSGNSCGHMKIITKKRDQDLELELIGQAKVNRANVGTSLDLEVALFRVGEQGHDAF